MTEQHPGVTIDVVSEARNEVTRIFDEIERSPVQSPDTEHSEHDSRNMAFGDVAARSAYLTRKNKLKPSEALAEQAAQYTRQAAKLIQSYRRAYHRE